MKKLIFSYLFLLTAFCTKAQIYEWASKVGGFSYEEGRGIAVDGSGNVYAAGTFYNTVDLDPGAGTVNVTSAGMRDLYLTKMDASGNLIWGRAVGGTDTEGMTDLAIDASGNVYITGSFSSTTADFDPGAGTFNLTTDGSNDVFILKLDASGNFVWAKKIGASTTTEVGFGIATDTAGNVFTTGYITGTTDFDPGAGTAYLSPISQQAAFISKLDPNGNYMWAKVFEGSAGDQTAYGVATDITGNVFITGYYENDIDLNPALPATNVLTSAGSADVFLIKYDPSGNFAWGVPLGGTGFDYAQNVTVDNSGNIYIIGSSDGVFDADPTGATYNLTPTASYDAFVVKLGAIGNLIWAHMFGGTLSDNAAQIAVDGSDNIYVAGTFNGTADLDPGVGTYNAVAAGGSQDMYVSKFDQAGNFFWARAMGAAGYDYASSICTGDIDRIYLTGSYENTIDLDPGAGTSNFTCAGGSDSYILKLRDCNISVSAGTDANICAGGSILLGATGATTYLWSTGAATSNVMVSPAVTTSYSVQGTTFAGCSDTDSVVVIVNPLPNVELGSDISGCYNSQIIGVTSEPNTLYNWTSNPAVLSSSNSTETVFPQGGPVTYYLSATHTLTACAANDSVVIDINPVPNADPGNDFFSCGGSPITVGTGAVAGIDYSWTSNPPGFTDDTSMVTVGSNVLTTYYLTANNSLTGCNATDSIRIALWDVPSWVGAGTTVNNLCVGDSITPSDYMYPVGGTLPYSIDWWNGPSHFYTVDFTYYPTTSLTFTVSLTDANGCSPGNAPLFVPVSPGPNTDLTGHVTTPLPANVTDGLVYAFKYQPASAGLDTIAITPLDGSGNYTFVSLDNSDYLIKVIPNELTYPLGVPTYFGNTFQWDSSIVVTHGCVQNDTANIEILELPTGPSSTGPGFISGYVVEGNDFGGNRLLGPGSDPDVPFAPGGPLKGVDVKLGKNPGGGIQARTMTDSTGYYYFDSIPLQGYTIYVDIPNLPMDSTRDVFLTVGTETSVQNNYFADSASVYVVDTLVAVGIYSSEKVYENNFTIFPNPAKDNLSVSLELQKEGAVTIEIYNALGQTIRSENNSNVSAGKFIYKINVASLNLQAGVYFISALNENKKYTQRIVIVD